MKLAYYPGCSLHGTAREYDISTRAVCEQLSITLEEVDDWNCCGATSAHSLDRELSFLLAARNIKLIQEKSLDAIIPCAACFSRICGCADALQNDNTVRQIVKEKLDFDFNNTTRFYHLMEFFAENIGMDKIKENVKTPLTDLKVVCYYGCLLVRPHNITKLDDKENPQFLDKLMTVAGATTIDWPYKTECCGASLSLSKPKLVVNLVKNMINWAHEANAQAIVTACPLCQANLEMRQTAKNKLPVFYFTELLGLSFGLEQVKSSLKKHLINTDKLVRKLTCEVS